MDNIIVVYDNDDVLFPLNEIICTKRNINIHKITDFYINTNKRLTSAEKEIIMQDYKDPDTFADMHYYEGADKIKEVERLSDLIQVWICSNSFSREIANHKLRQLPAITGITPDRIALNIINDENNTEKKLPDNVTIFIDDSPYNIAKSSAKLNIMVKQPWNMSNRAIGLAGSATGSLRVAKNTLEANNIVIESVKELLRREKNK